MAKLEDKKPVSIRDWVPIVIGISGIAFLSLIGAGSPPRPYGAAGPTEHVKEEKAEIRVGGKKGTLQRFKGSLMHIYLFNLISRTFTEFSRDDGTAMAGGISYFFVLALFPLLLGIMSILGLVLSSESIQKAVFDFVTLNVPGAASVILDNIKSVIQARGALGIISILGLLWSGSAAFGIINTAVNRSWDINKRRSFWRKTALHLGLELSTGLLFLASMALTSGVEVIRKMGLPFSGIVADIAAWAVAFLLIVCIFLVIYKVMPMTKTHWRDVWVGAIFAGVMFEIARSAFTLYLSRFANYANVYGSIASVIILFVWIYYSALVIIFGAEIASENYRLRNGIERGSREECAPEGPGGIVRGAG